MLSRPYDEFNLVQELSWSTPTANLLTERGIDETFTRTDAGGTSSFLVDALGSTLELADGSGALRTHYTFEPFGATTTSGVSSRMRRSLWAARTMAPGYISIGRGTTIRSSSGLSAKIHSDSGAA